MDRILTSDEQSTSRRSVIQEARLLLDSNPVYLDTETTGLHQSAEVIEIGIIDDQGNIFIEQRIRPRGNIDPGAQRMHGITLEMLADAPTWEQVWPQAEAVLLDQTAGSGCIMLSSTCD